MSQALSDELQSMDEAWRARPVLRSIYGEWYRLLADRLSPVAGDSIELGSGIGALRGVTGDRVVLTDVVQTRWVDRQVDALALPYEDGSLANILMIDVFHHLADPARFLDEATRALRPGGRVLMVEPYCSPVSTPLYKGLHHERTDLSVDVFAADARSASDPMESNQAIPTLAFYRHRAETLRRWTSLGLVEERRFAFVIYPLSGGFSRPPLVPPRLLGPLHAMEWLLQPLARLLAFRCLIVLERLSA